MIRGVKFVSIPTRDQDRALEFWTRQVGFQIATDQPFGGGAKALGAGDDPDPAMTEPDQMIRQRRGGTAEPLAILKVEAYDPEGDGQENNNLTPKIYDGDKGTGWFSENYRTDTFGGLKKGLGVIVDLGPNKKP